MRTCEAMHADGEPGTPVECGRMAALMRRFESDDGEVFLCAECARLPSLCAPAHTDHSTRPPHHQIIAAITEPDKLASLEGVIDSLPDPSHAMFGAEWIRALAQGLRTAWEERDKLGNQLAMRNDELIHLREQVGEIAREVTAMRVSVEERHREMAHVLRLAANLSAAVSLPLPREQVEHARERFVEEWLRLVEKHGDIAAPAEHLPAPTT